MREAEGGLPLCFVTPAAAHPFIDGPSPRLGEEAPLPTQKTGGNCIGCRTCFPGDARASYRHRARVSSRSVSVKNLQMMGFLAFLPALIAAYVLFFAFSPALKHHPKVSYGFVIPPARP